MDENIEIRPARVSVDFTNLLKTYRYDYDPPEDLVKMFIRGMNIREFSIRKFGIINQTPELLDALLEEGLDFREEDIEIPIESLSKKVQAYLKLL